MNEIERKIIAAIKAKPMASQQELATSLDMSRESVAGYIMRLTRRGAILGKGYILPKPNHILVLGGANVDLTGISHAAFRAGDSNPGKVSQSAGGVGRNIAENLARLGNDVSLISIIGNDNHGRYLLEHARSVGIGTEDIIHHPDFATSTYLAMNNERGELIGSIADMAIIEQLTPSILSDKLPQLQAATTLVVEANLPEPTLAWLGEQNFTAPIIADAVSASKAPRLCPLLHRIDVLKVNRAEAMAILALTEQERLTDQQLITALLNLGVRSVLLSLSERGVLFADANTQLLQAVPSCHMQSDTGAGDALLAGFVHSTVTTDDETNRIRFAIACAATTLESKDAVAKNLTESYVNHRFNNFLNNSTDTDHLELEK